ncbi:MAG: BREX system P-loop protein BrxC [Firmicutes bacterium]|nr:BREX system P-loop protein BrxC [Bacillota bacterium]
MLIKDLFAKDLFRHINGVVKADQDADAIVWQELDEYVVTKELDKLFQKFLSSYLQAIDNPNDPNATERMGIWISGFFGSGKSHFLKILSYILNNKEAYDPASGQKKKAAQFFESKIKDSLLYGDIKRATVSDTDVILFNIDSKADARDGRGAILNVFWSVFNKMRGFCSDAPHVAEIERYLTEKGKYKDFCNNYESLTGCIWIEERDAFHFNRDVVTQALAQTLGQSQSSAEEIFDKAEKNLSITIDIFAKRVKEYLDSKGKAHRIIFLVDEVGQFIGDDGHLMLNLQTITEDLGRVCQGRAWVVVTSQEDIDAVLGDLKASKANDFSKIQGRFNTRLPLSSSNTDEVIQTRLLTKKAEVIAALEQLFSEKGDILKNQLSFSQDSASMKNYKDSRDFVENYPFAPYHFQLVQKIFEAIRKVGATGLHLSKGERSMLDAFQSAAKEISNKEIGALVPLYEFYPSIESFLDTSVKRTIDQASENDGLERPFDVLLLKTLFLVRYVDIIKPNVDNLVTLFIDKVDADRLALKRTIEAGLQRLEKQTLVSKNGDLYYFLTNEEREVDQAIKTVDITGTEENRQLGEFVFDEILNEKSKHKYNQNKRDYGFSRLIDGHPYGSKIDQELSLEFITPLSSEYALFNDTKCVMYSSEHNGRLVIKLGDSPELGREVRLWLQVNKFVLSKSDASTSENSKKILSDRQEQNRGRRERIAGLLTNLILAAEFYALGQTLEVKGSSPRVTIDSGLDYLVQNLYSKFGFLKTISDEPSKEVKATLLSNDIGQVELIKGLVQINPEAVKEVSTFIKLKLDINHSVHVSDLVEQFVKRPFGWPEGEIVLLVARIFMAGEIKLLIDGDSLEPRDAVDSLSKSAKWKNIKVIKRKQASKEDIEKASKLCKDLFGKIVPEVADDLSKAL